MAGEVIYERLDHSERFAAYLRMLKSRSGHGFTQLGKLAGVSSSSLHRYCSGASVPQDYRIVLSIARSCGATTEEIRQLHRLWAAAEAVRHTEPARQPQTVTGSPAVADPAPEPAATSGPEPAAEPVATSEPESMPEPATAPAPVPAEGEPAPSRRTLHLAIAVVGVVVVLIAGGLVALRGTPGGSGPAVTDDRMLFSRACQEPVSMGQNDDCVLEVQTLLSRTGAKIGIDGAFGPETLRRVTAFQVLSGLPARGIVDEATKKALYAPTARLDTWPPERVESRIREVFPEDADRAVAIARCQSRLDPLHILPNTNGSRNWGVFQISDSTLARLDGTPAKALDPEWNINAARQLWSAQRDFHHWPFCEAALNATPQPSGR